MKNTIKFAIIMFVVIISFNTANAQSQKDRKEIEAVIITYQRALSAADANLASSLYTKNAKFMPQGGPSALGVQNIKESYNYVFSLITPTIEFNIDEILFIGTSAIVTSTSKGTSLVKANNENVPEINREFFLFEKENGIWKISRYMFNKVSQ
ncbi:SgcJ/EcaC family oxidoreductase [Flavobacterium sp. J27]|uniref:YybH family protein n=1 Tax=Flavobacterium sp. J27 TaxID=2060419 RepID=UPI00102F548F|nr:nuclear transport factor 2 family protein [Flavobacterium sp. J27]